MPFQPHDCPIILYFISTVTLKSDATITIITTIVHFFVVVQRVQGATLRPLKDL